MSVPALAGCHSQGDTLENIREAAELWLEVADETAVARASSEGPNDAGLTDDDL